jgi:FkbM family methyltransferase
MTSQKLERLRRRFDKGGWAELIDWARQWIYWNLKLYRVPIQARHIRDDMRELRVDAAILGQAYEPRVRQVMSQYIKPGWVCVDLGANIGQSALAMAPLAKPGGKVIAFEAFPHNAARLRRNLRIRGFGKDVQVENLAVSDGQAHRLTIYAGRNKSDFEWNVIGRDVTGQTTAAEMEIAAVALDEYFPPGSRINFIKIDIEGAEALALAGMRRVLRESQPIIVIEFHNDDGWAGRHELYSAGYTLYDLKGGLIHPNDKRRYQCLALPPNMARYA